MIRSHPAGPDDTDSLLFAREPAVPYFNPVKEPVIANVECVSPKELCDYISWSVRLLVQQGACTAVSSRPSSVCLGNPQLQTKREKSECVHGINYSICGFDPCRRWWSTLALFWIAFAEKPIDSTELISAVTAAGKDHFPANSDLFAGRPSPNEVELADILSKSLIVSEAGRITLSSEEAKTVLIHIVSDPGGTDEGAIHELIAYTCLRCIEHYQPTSIFRPWTISESYLDHQSTSSRLLLYAASFWHVRFRLAEGRSRRLSALLHRIIQSVLSSNKNNYWGFNPTLHK